MAAVGSASGSANYFAKDNYYSNEESAEASMWHGSGAEMLGLAPGDDNEAELIVEAAPEEAIDSDALLDGEAVEGEIVDDTAADVELVDTEALGDPQTDHGAPQDESSEATADRPAGDGPERQETPSEGAEATDQPASPDAADPPVTDANGGAEQAPQAPDDRPSIAFDVDVDLDIASLPALEGPADTRASTENVASERFPLTNPTGKVDAQVFENILNGKLPDGTQVGEPGKRALGMDLTHSAPKSVSILALVGGDKRVLEAHNLAVQSAGRFAATHFAEGRIKHQGSAVPVRTGNLVYALFTHDTSRSLDPQLHTHMVIANMTRMPNGEWRSLHNGQIWKNNTVIGSVYHAALRESLEKLGYTVELQGKHGSFEVVGVPKDVREAFSQRREAILAKSVELGIASHKGLDRITTNTRDPKLKTPEHSALLNSWKERIAALGYDPKSTIDAAAASLNGPKSLIEQTVRLGSTVKTGLERAAEYVRDGADPLHSSRKTKLGLTATARTEIAVASGIRHLEQREAAFGVHQLTKAALDRGLSGVTPESIARRVTELIRADKLVPGVPDRADKLVTMLATADALKTERAILGNIERGQGQTEPLVKPDFAGEVIAGVSGERELNADQLAAATSIISSSDRIIVVQGIAGAGKSTMLATAARVLDNYGKNVRGLAFQNKMVGDLAEGAGIKAQTLASFLMPYERMIAENDRAGLNAARKEMRGSVVIVDEASMVSNKQMASLTGIANRLELDKLVLVGDRQQLLSIDAGKSFALAQAGGTSTTRMDDNLRQRTPQMRAVAALTNQGKASDALKVLGKGVISTGDRIGEAATRWLNLSHTERDRTMVLTSGRETRSELNQAIQSGLKLEGTLKGDGLTLTVNEHVDRTREDLRDAKYYEPGLRLSLWGDEKSVGLKRGEYRIAQLVKGGRVQLTRGSKKLIIDPKRLSPARREDRITMIATKEIKIHEGDKIRWTGNDKDRGIHNSALGRVLAIDTKGVTIEAADKSVVRLDTGDPMLRKLDLAYALNMHMAQGVTTDKAMIVMGSEERFLANQRLFNVGVTRARDGVTVITDDQIKLSRQLERTPGGKLSALEVTGQLTVDLPKQGVAPIDLGTIPKEAYDRSAPMLKNSGIEPVREPELKQAPTVDLPVPEKVKGLSL